MWEETGHSPWETFGPQQIAAGLPSKSWRGSRHELDLHPLRAAGLLNPLATRALLNFQWNLAKISPGALSLPLWSSVPGSPSVRPADNPPIALLLHIAVFISDFIPFIVFLCSPSYCVLHLLPWRHHNLSLTPFTWYSIILHKMYYTKYL